VRVDAVKMVRWRCCLRVSSGKSTPEGRQDPPCTSPVPVGAENPIESQSRPASGPAIGPALVSRAAGCATHCPTAQTSAQPSGRLRSRRLCGSAAWASCALCQNAT
jgi:hypothetical protein